MRARSASRKPPDNRVPLQPPGERASGKALPRGRGFQRGAANVRNVDTAALAARKAATVLLKAAERERLVQKYHPGGLPAFQGSARTTPLSDRELLTLKMRAEASTPPSIAELAAELGRCPTTIKKGLKRALEPLTPLGAAEKRRRRGGRKRLLTPEQNAFLRATIKKDPIGGPAEAAKALFRVHGVRASRWTIARELHRLYQPGDKPVRKRGTERYAPLTDGPALEHAGGARACHDGVLRALRAARRVLARRDALAAAGRASFPSPGITSRASRRLPTRHRSAIRPRRRAARFRTRLSSRGRF
jgi:hypothetical protein